MRPAAGSARRRVGGFTLIEVMVVVGIIAVIAAIAIPVLTGYIRRSKASEVQKNLDWCFRTAKEYYASTHWRDDGGVKVRFTNQLPDGMDGPLCPDGIAAPKDLDGGSRFIPPGSYVIGGPGGSFKQMGFLLTDATYACYQFTIDSENAFSCRAFTDIDNDEEVAEWVKTGTYNPATQTYEGGAVYHVDGTDDY